MKFTYCIFMRSGPWRLAATTPICTEDLSSNEVATQEAGPRVSAKVSKHIDTQLVDNLRHLIFF